VLVVVSVVGGVPMPVVDVVDMVAVRDRDMTAALTVDVVVRGDLAVPVGFTLVEVPLVRPVQVSVVDIVDVITVRDRDMTAVRPVYMRVVGMLIVCRCHRCSLFSRSGCSARNGHLGLRTGIHYQVRINAGSYLCAEPRRDGGSRENPSTFPAIANLDMYPNHPIFKPVSGIFRTVFMSFGYQPRNVDGVGNRRTTAFMPGGNSCATVLAGYSTGNTVMKIGHETS
jgi:hypothetical protein